MRYEKLDSKLVFLMSENPEQQFSVVIHTTKLGNITGVFNLTDIDDLSEDVDVSYIELFMETNLVVAGRSACSCKCGCHNEQPVNTGMCDYCSIYLFDEVSAEHQ